jgi:5-methylcytosine-specific restriction endonuclease McrA
MRNGGEWTEARFRSFVTSSLRAASRRWPVKFKALKEAFVGRKTNNKTGKLAMHYKCVSCKKHFVAADVQVDHIAPVVDPVKGFLSWDVYIDNLFCELNNLQILCMPCHKEKTAEEKLMRKKK